ncbi:MAG: hypothetical protein KY475_27005 [Planctomycetes bacterium]|nr:hypothetical protein [Planctomycetota bacterium]
MQAHVRGRKLSRQDLRYRFRTACRVLVAERVREPAIHYGRHMFVSRALAGGRTLAEVREAAGNVGSLFAPESNPGEWRPPGGSA